MVMLFSVTSCDSTKEMVPDDLSNSNTSDMSLAQIEKNPKDADVDSKTVVDKTHNTTLKVTPIPSPVAFTPTQIQSSVAYTPTPVPEDKSITASDSVPTAPPQPTPTFTVVPSPTPVQLDETYANDTIGISMDYPSSWVIEENEASQSWLLKILSPLGSSVEIFGNYAPNVELKQFVSARIGLDGQYMEQNRVLIEYMPGYFSEGNHVFTRNSIKIVMFLKDEWAIHATFTVLESQDESTLDLIRDSFKLKIP